MQYSFLYSITTYNTHQIWPFRKSNQSRVIISPPLKKPLKDYIIEKQSARIGRTDSYLDTIDKIGLSKQMFYIPKKYRKFSNHQLSRREIKKYVIGKTLRRPCFDLFFSPDGLCKTSWVDNLVNLKYEVASKERKKLGFKNSNSHVPVYNHQASWYWKDDAIMRDFGNLYGRPLKTEFFFQNNGLISIKSNNINETIWYDLLIFNQDLLDDFGLDWNNISQYMDIASNIKQELIANNVPQFFGDKKLRKYS